MGNQHVIKINLQGGIVSPGDLREILKIAANCGIDSVRFGNRQQLLFLVAASRLEDLLDSFEVSDIVCEVDADLYPNIVSSYVTDEIFSAESWLREGVYKDILDGFSHQPQLKINIIDQYQDLIPFFTGNLNYISSETSNYWYLYVRFPKTNIMFCWPSLVYSEDIAGLSLSIEQVICSEPSVFYGQPKINSEALYRKVSTKNFSFQPYEHPLIHTGFQLPFYEGLNKYGNNKLWLGIYRRKEIFNIDFLAALCELCLQTHIGQLYITCWKSVLVKSICQEDRKFWGTLLDKHRINVRHAANELNWQLEDLCDEAIILKLGLVKKLEEADQRTSRLCFAIKTQPNTGLFASIIIQKMPAASKKDSLYDVLHTRDFNPNSKDFVTFSGNVRRAELAEKILQICDYFYSLYSTDVPSLVGKPEEKLTVEKVIEVYQCKYCMTIYNETYGDELNRINPGTKFEDITTYLCPVCDAAKENFVAIQG